MPARVAVIAGLVAASLRGGEVLFQYESARTYSSSREIDAGVFADRSRLRSYFEAFVRNECKGRVVAQLVVSPAARHMLYAANRRFPTYPWSFELMAEIRESSLKMAQVLCFEGNATAVVRDGMSITSYSLAGTRDARELTLGSVALKVIGFYPRNLPDRSGKPADWVIFFAEATGWPKTTRARAVHRELERRLGARTNLLIRRDPFFFPFGGALTNLFETPLRRVTSAEAMDAAYMHCSSEAKRRCSMAQLPVADHRRPVLKEGPTTPASPRKK